jgi:hypothetical protein
MIPTLTDKPCVMGEAVQFSQLAASCITLCSGKAIVVIKPDGTIDYQGSTPDEAAQAFWDSVGRLHPAKKTAAELAAPELLTALKTCTCPRPANIAPDDTTVEQCMARKECGCDLGTVVAKATGGQA